MNPAKMSAVMILLLLSVFLLMAAVPGHAEIHRPAPVQSIVYHTD